MYTKILLLVILYILIPFSVSIGFNNNKTNLASQKSEVINMQTAPENKMDNNLPAAIDWSDIPHNNCSDHSNHHNGDDDGKTHHFHFQHCFHTRRRTIIFNIIARIIILLCCVSSLMNTILMYYSFSK